MAKAQENNDSEKQQGEAKKAIKAKANQKTSGNKGKKEGGTVEPKKMNANQRIASLENLVMVQRDQINILADELDKMRNTMASVTKRLNAVIQAGESGEINNDSINDIVLEQTVEELKGRVTHLQNQGVLKQNDSKESIDERTFVVGRQVDEEGNVVSPRVQFAVGSLDDSLKVKVVGGKLGDLIPDEHSGTSVEITEVYDIVDPQVNKQFDKEEQSQSTTKSKAKSNKKKSTPKSKAEDSKL